MKLVPFLMTTKGLCVRCNKRRKMAIEKRYVTMNTSFRHMQGNPRQSWILDSRYLTLDSGRFFVSGTGIPDSSR